MVQWITLISLTLLEMLNRSSSKMRGAYVLHENFAVGELIYNLPALRTTQLCIMQGTLLYMNIYRRLHGIGTVLLVGKSEIKAVLSTPIF